MIQSQIQNNPNLSSSLKNPQNSLKHKAPISTLQTLLNQDKHKFVQVIESISHNPRHGLFGQAPSLAIGDKYHDKKPDQALKNILVNPKLQDRVQPQIFSRFGSTNIGDPYKDRFRSSQLYDKEKVDMIPHSQPFLPTQTRKQIKNSQFQHLKEYDDKIYNTRNQNGQVKISKRNFLTNPMKRGSGSSHTGHLFSQFKYLSSQYDSERQQSLKQRAEHKAKILVPFVSHSHTKNLFTQNYHTLNKAINQPHQQIKPQKVQTLFGAWKATNPSKRGYEKTFERFPVYIEEGEKKNKIVHENIWRPNYNGTSGNFRDTLSKPCPVPSQIFLNDLRRSK